MHWVIGDIHGCREPLERLLERIAFDPADDTLWSTGDLVNRGPDSLGVLRLWFQLDGRGVLGNHDVYALQAAAGGRRQRTDDLDALLHADDAATLLGRLATWPILLRLPVSAAGGRSWLVHGGLHPEWHDLDGVAARFDLLEGPGRRLRDPDLRFATRVRYCRQDGTLSKVDAAGSALDAEARPWDDWYAGAERVVHGHWAQRGHYVGRRTLGLDSGCVYGGALTAWCVEEDRIVQVDGNR